MYVCTSPPFFSRSCMNKLMQQRILSRCSPYLDHVIHSFYRRHTHPLLPAASPFESMSAPKSTSPSGHSVVSPFPRRKTCSPSAGIDRKFRSSLVPGLLLSGQCNSVARGLSESHVPGKAEGKASCSSLLV